MNAANVLCLQRMVGNATTRWLLTTAKPETTNRPPAPGPAVRDSRAAPQVQRVALIGSHTIESDPRSRWSINGTEKDADKPDSVGGPLRHGIELQINYGATDEAPNGHFDLIQTTNIKNDDGSVMAFGNLTRDQLRTDRGWVVDIPHEHRVGQKGVSPYYREHGNVGGGAGQSGYKIGTLRQDAVLQDFPSGSGPMRFLFETVVKPEGQPDGRTRAALDWDFDVVRRRDGTLHVENDEAEEQTAASKSFNAAMAKHSEHYRA
jgi:hypothetical protein